MITIFSLSLFLLRQRRPEEIAERAPLHAKHGPGERRCNLLNHAPRIPARRRRRRRERHEQRRRRRKRGELVRERRGRRDCPRAPESSSSVAAHPTAGRLREHEEAPECCRVRQSQSEKVWPRRRCRGAEKGRQRRAPAITRAGAGATAVVLFLVVVGVAITRPVRRDDDIGEQQGVFHDASAGVLLLLLLRFFWLSF